MEDAIGHDTPLSNNSVSTRSRSVIGPQRDNYADFRSMRVEVEVVSGDGQVLPFIQAVDNGTGDVTVRSE